MNCCLHCNRDNAKRQFDFECKIIFLGMCQTLIPNWSCSHNENRRIKLWLLLLIIWIKFVYSTSVVRENRKKTFACFLVNLFVMQSQRVRIKHQRASLCWVVKWKANDNDNCEMMKQEWLLWKMKQESAINKIIQSDGLYIFLIRCSLI